MKIAANAALFALLSGIIGLILIFVIGSISGSGETGFIVGYFLYLCISIFLVWKQNSAWWYTAILINIPVWGFFFLLAEKGQFDQYFRNLIYLLISSCIGSLIGLWLSKIKK